MGLHLLSEPNPRRISEIHVYQKDLPVVGGPYTMSTMTLHEIDTTIIKLVSDTGLIGWGEVAPIGPPYQPQHALGARAAIGEMAQALTGQSCLTPLLLRRRMDGLLNGHNYAKAAIDIAVMDLIGKHFGLRICDLLGGAEAERPPGYYAIGIGEPGITTKPRLQRYPVRIRTTLLHDGRNDIDSPSNCSPDHHRRKPGKPQRSVTRDFDACV